MFKTKKTAKIKLFKNGFVFVLGGLVFSVITLTPIMVQAGTIAPAGTYTDITMPGSNLTNIAHDVSPSVYTGDAYFWSHQFNFMHAPPNGGAYFGIQGINKAVFSVFNWPSPAASPVCKTQTSGFDGGAYSFGGTSCLIDYPVSISHTYHMEVTDVGHDTNGINWQATVSDIQTGKTTVIATINVPLSWGELSASSVVWSEYFAGSSTPRTSCTQVPYSNVTFSNFTANKGQYKAPVSHNDHITQNDCSKYSRITDRSANSFTQEMGMPTPVTDNIIAAPPGSTLPNGNSVGGGVDGGDGAPAPYKPGSPLNPLPPVPTSTCGEVDTKTKIDGQGIVCVPTTEDSSLKGVCADRSQPSADNSCGIVKRYISPTINFSAVIFGVIAAILIATGGMQYSSSGGDPERVAAAKKRILNTIFALIAFGLIYGFLNFIIPGGL